MSTSATSGTAVNGPFVIGYTLCFTLMGALSIQAYIYFTRFTDDHRAVKALVTAVLLLETTMTVFVFCGFWVSSTQLFSDPAIGPPMVVSMPLVLAPITGVVTTLTHGFYCWRILTLGKSRPIPLAIMTVSLLQLVSITCLAFSGSLSPLSGNLMLVSLLPYVGTGHDLSPWLVTWLGSSVVCDLTITICMILSLRPSRTYFERSKSIMVKLTRLTIETGLVTTAAALLELIIGIVYKEYLYHVAVFYAISKLYANCMLASLNFRLVLRSRSDPNLTAIVWDDAASYTQSRQPGSRASHVTQILARVETNVSAMTDPNEASPGKDDSIEDEMHEYELDDASTQV